jgi:hypothetical protein
MPAISDTLRKLNPWHKGKYIPDLLTTTTYIPLLSHLHHVLLPIR